MKRQIILILGFSILFILSCFFPSVIGFSSMLEESFSCKSGSPAAGDIIIVDDEGDGDFIRIQDALNHSNQGDTIEVYSGTYYEFDIYIRIEGIMLKGIPYEHGNGSDTGKPFINGEGKGDLIFIEAKNVIIDGFKIENDGGTLANGIMALRQGADGSTISNNDIAHSTMACIWVKSSNNTIINNNISYSVIRQGIVLRDPCSNCLVSGNVISNVETGILCWDSNHNTITGNKISKCSRFGLDIAGGEFNTVKGNTFDDNTIGIHLYYGVGSRIKNNNFIDNQIQAHFEYGIPPFWVLLNRWNGNYWGEPRLLPYPIRGVYFFIPWIQFDWFPAKYPYDI
jgi:parallel beta-helix repeat protein